MSGLKTVELCSEIGGSHTSLHTLKTGTLFTTCVGGEKYLKLDRNRGDLPVDSFDVACLKLSSCAIINMSKVTEAIVLDEDPVLIWRAGTGTAHEPLTVEDFKKAYAPLRNAARRASIEADRAFLAEYQTRFDAMSEAALPVAGSAGRCKECGAQGHWHIIGNRAECKCDKCAGIVPM